MTTTEIEHPVKPRGLRFSCALITEPGPTAPIRILRIGGELDISSYGALRSALDAAVSGTADEPTRYLLVDFSQVVFCSARGLALVHDIAAPGRADGEHYALCGVSPRLSRLADMLWPDGHPMRRHTLAAAVTALRTEQAEPSPTH